MFKQIAAVSLIAMPLFALAAGAEAQHEGPSARFQPAAAASAPAAAAPKGKVSQRQLMAACKAQVAASGAKGADHRAALRNCLKGS